MSDQELAAIAAVDPFGRLAPAGPGLARGGVAVFRRHFDVDRERISLGIKQLDQDPFTTFATVNDKGQIVTGTVTSVDAKGAEIDLGNEVMGYLRASEISRDRTEDASQVLKVGDEVNAVVVNVDRKTRNIQLSIKAKDAADQQEAMANLSQNTGSAGTTSLGALLRAKLDNNEK